MDMYLLLSFASGVAITTLAFILLLVRIEPDEESRKIRFARAILAASYFLLAVPDWLNIYRLNDSEDIAAATIGSPSSSVASMPGLPSMGRLSHAASVMTGMRASRERMCMRCLRRRLGAETIAQRIGRCNHGLGGTVTG